MLKGLLKSGVAHFAYTYDFGDNWEHTVAIEKTVLRWLGVKLTPHQFRHIVAKIILDANPGAYELVRQMLGHKNMKTTTSFYAGIDTRRAGRAHAELIMKLRENQLGRGRRRPTSRPEKD